MLITEDNRIIIIFYFVKIFYKEMRLIMKSERWKAVLYYSVHIIPVILILVFTYTDILYNFKEPVTKQIYTIPVRALGLFLILFINAVLNCMGKIIYLSKRQRLVKKIIVLYLAISFMPNILCYLLGANEGMQFYSPDKKILLHLKNIFF